MTIEQARDTLRRDYGVETAEEYRAAIEAARVRIRDAKRDIEVLDRCAQTAWSRAEWQTPALADLRRMAEADGTWGTPGPPASAGGF